MSSHYKRVNWVGANGSVVRVVPQEGGGGKNPYEARDEGGLMGCY